MVKKTNLEDFCVGVVCAQNEHRLPIRLPLVYVDSKEVEGSTGSGDDNGDGGGPVDFVAGDPPALVIEGLHNPTLLVPHGACEHHAGRSYYCPGCGAHVHFFYGVAVDD